MKRKFTLLVIGLFLSLFTTNAQTWQQIGSDIDGETAGGQSGHSVSLSSDGNNIAFGAYGNNSGTGHVRVYKLQTYVPDDNFEQALIDLGYDSGDLDDYVPTANISGITSLNINDKNIGNLTGIEDFTALTTLSCYSNQLSSLDVSSNTVLTEINCSSNQLTSIDISANTELKKLYCNSNQLTSLNVSANTALTNLGCTSNQLTSLDLSLNTALTVLSCGENQLSILDVSANTNLTKLYCHTNQFTNLDVSANVALTELYCYSNQLTSLDILANTALTNLSCTSNQLTSLDVSNNIALIILECSENLITSLDVSANTALRSFSCQKNQLTGIDISANVALQSLSCYSNQLTNLDVSSNTALIGLYCHENQLTNLDVSLNTALTNLRCKDNQLVNLDIRNGNNANVTFFDASDNPDLTCILVDDKTAEYLSDWTKDETADFVNTESECVGWLPVVITQPTGQINICPGDEIEFSVDAEYVNEYQWQVSTDDASSWNGLSENDTYINVNNDTLTILTTTTGLDGYQFRCELSGNGGNIISDTVLLSFETEAPIPDASTLDNITGECSVTVSETPTSTDNCSGTITGTTTDPLQYAEQGTYTITWTYDDGNGNTSTQEQTVIISDDTNPAITCVGNQNIEIESNKSTYIVSGTELDPVSTSDNCGVEPVKNDFNNTATLDGAEFPVGTTTVTWTVTDIAGNTAECNFDVIVSKGTGINNLEKMGISIYPNPVNNILNIDCVNDNIARITVLDITGKVIIEKTEISETEQIDMSGFNSGIYLISIDNGKNIYTSKLIKK